MNTGPIGIFDSGVGGISITKEIHGLIPYEDILYFSDNAYCPYGIKPVDDIRKRAFAIVDLLVQRGAKVIVVACNTATIAAVDVLRESFALPIVGIEPAVKPAVAATRNGRVGVLATSVALSGDRFAHLVERHASHVEVFTQPAPGLVELVEAGLLDGPEASGLLHCYLDPLMEKGVDTVVLGCTHYPFLRPLVEGILGSGTVVIDTGAAVARQTARVLENHGLMGDPAREGTVRFLTSGHLEAVEPVIRLLWGDPGAHVAQVQGI